MTMSSVTATTYIMLYLQQNNTPKSAREIICGIAEMYNVSISLRTVHRTLNNFCELCKNCCVVDKHKSYYRNQPITKYMLKSTADTTKQEIIYCPPCPNCQ